jgi:hypothetical protein
LSRFVAIEKLWRGNLRASLDDVICLRALPPLDDFKYDRLTLFLRAVSKTDDG